MRIYVKYNNYNTKGFIGFMIFYCIAIVGIAIGTWLLMPYVLQSISENFVKPLENEFFAAAYKFGGWINWIERGISLVICVWESIWVYKFICGESDDIGVVIGFAFFIWVVYRIIIAILKTLFGMLLQNKLFWIIIAAEIIIFLVPFIVTFIVWRIGKKKAIKKYKQQIASCGINQI